MFTDGFLAAHGGRFAIISLTIDVMQWILIVISVFLVSSILTGIIIPQILLISFRKRLFDEPDERKIHKAAVPRLGGLAFMPSIVFSLCLVTGTLLLSGAVLSSTSEFPLTQALVNPITEGYVTPLCFGLCAMMMMYLVGIADDLIGVKYRAKFFAQILVGLMLAAAGVRVESLNGMFGVYDLPLIVSWPLTVFLVVFITNAINLIDGIDGLASGLSGIAMIFYGMFFMAAGQWIYCMISFATLGTLVPFFYFNVFGSPARGKKIFMGDTGSLTIGLVLSFLALQLSDVSNNWVFAADVLVVAFAPLAIPCLDVVRVFVHRVIRGNSPFLPDRVHIHHKLLALGFPQRPAMITILAASAGMIGLNLLISPAVSTFFIIVIDFLIWVVANYLLTKAIRRRQQREGITHGYD